MRDQPSPASSIVPAEFARSIGERLKHIRKLNRLTQPEVSELLGVSTAAYKRYELGLRIPDAIFCAAFAQSFNLDANWLLTGNYLGSELNSSEETRRQKSRLLQAYTLAPVFELSTHKRYIRLVSDKPVDEIAVPSNILSPTARVVRYTDRNMLPTISPNSTLLISTDLSSTGYGKIIAVFLPSKGVSLYRPYSSSPGNAILKSDNLAYPDISLTSENLQKYTVGVVSSVIFADLIHM